LWDRFCEAMDDDFNTARGIGILFEGVRHINRMLDENDPADSSDMKQTVLDESSDILKIGNILGILALSPKAYFEAKRSKSLEKGSIDPVVIEKIVNQRMEARKAKDWAKADEIRKQLEEMNIIIEDRPEGTVWKIIDK